MRERVFAHYLGNSDAADAFKAGVRIPNILQNLFGEGVLSASFIPVYARLLAREGDEEAAAWPGRCALLALPSCRWSVGVLATPVLIAAHRPGFQGEKRELTVRLVRILFPGAGLLVLSAWCLGVLNSHHRFFLSYTAPVLWNLAIIAALLVFGGTPRRIPLADRSPGARWSGSALQFGVQVPVVLRLLERLAPRLARRPNVRTVFRNLAPVVVGRGVVQISAYVDNLLASLLPTGAVSGLSYAQILYLLPVSLFGMSVAAAELPTMSSAAGDEGELAALRERLEAGPPADRLLRGALGRGLPGAGRRGRRALFQIGSFTQADDALRLGDPRRLGGGPAGGDAGPALLVHLLRAAGHPHAAALRDHPRRPHPGARLPLRHPTARLAGHRSAVGRRRPHRFGGHGRVGRVHPASAGLNRRIGRTGMPVPYLARLWGSALSRRDRCLGGEAGALPPIIPCW